MPPPVILVMAILVVVPSIPFAHKFGGGWPGLVLYGLLAFGGYALSWRIETAAGWSALVRRRERLLLGAAVLFILLSFAILYPLAQSGLFGAGSDRDDALTVGVTRLLAGEFPYYGVTYFGTPLSPMPGALVLAMPFHLLGSVAWQNPMWFTVGLLLGMESGRELRSRVLFAAAPLIGSVATMQDLVTGGDFVAATVYVAAGLWLVHRAAAGVEPPRPWPLALAAAFLGIAVLSRPVFGTAGIVAGAFILQRHGLRAALIYAAGGLTTLTALTVPFLLYDAAAFFPQHLARLLPPQIGALNHLLIVAGFVAAGWPLLRPVRTVQGLYAVMAASLSLMLVIHVLVRTFTFDRYMIGYLNAPGFFIILALLPSVRRLADAAAGMAARPR